MARDRDRRRRRIHRSYDRSGSGNNTSGRTTQQGIAAGELLENVVQDVMQAGESTGFQGVVDVELNLRNTAVDAKGVLVSLFSGSDSKTSSTSIKLATRVYLKDPPSDTANR